MTLRKWGLVLILFFSSSLLYSQDFFKDEVLCDIGEGGSARNAMYAVARVIRAAENPGTDQSEVVFLRNGVKANVDFVIPTHRAGKSEMVLDALVFIPLLKNYTQNRTDPLSQENYRRVSWVIGSITSVVHLYKGLVEVDGLEYTIKSIRVPDNPSALE